MTIILKIFCFFFFLIKIALKFVFHIQNKKSTTIKRKRLNKYLIKKKHICKQKKKKNKIKKIKKINDQHSIHGYLSMHWIISFKEEIEENFILFMNRKIYK